MTRQERLQTASELLAEAFEALGHEWPLLATSVSHAQSQVAFSLKQQEEAA